MATLEYLKNCFSVFGCWGGVCVRGLSKYTQRKRRINPATHRSVQAIIQLTPVIQKTAKTLSMNE